MTYVLNILKTNYTLTLTANDVVVALSFSAGIMSIAAASITDGTSVGRALITAAGVAAARTTLGLDTKSNFNTALTDGDFQFVGDAPTAHTHLLAAGATDVTITAANLNALDDGVNTTLHFHDADRARAYHTGTQAATTILPSGGGTLQDYVGFATRAAFVTWATGKTPAVGLVINAAGLGYRYISTGTAISDLPGWVPYYNITPNHWTQNLTPRTTDMTTAFQAAVTYAGTFNSSSQGRPPVYLLGEEYLVSAAINIQKDFTQIIGVGSRSSLIVALTEFGTILNFANVDPTTAAQNQPSVIGVGFRCFQDTSSNVAMKFNRCVGINIYDVEITSLFGGIEIYGGTNINLVSVIVSAGSYWSALKSGSFGLKLREGPVATNKTPSNIFISNSDFASADSANPRLDCGWDIGCLDGIIVASSHILGCCGKGGIYMKPQVTAISPAGASCTGITGHVDLDAASTYGIYLAKAVDGVGAAVAATNYGNIVLAGGIYSRPTANHVYVEPGCTAKGINMSGLFRYAGDSGMMLLGGADYCFSGQMIASWLNGGAEKSGIVIDNDVQRVKIGMDMSNGGGSVTQTKGVEVRNASVDLVEVAGSFYGINNPIDDLFSYLSGTNTGAKSYKISTDKLQFNVLTSAGALQTLAFADFVELDTDTADVTGMICRFFRRRITVRVRSTRKFVHSATQNGLWLCGSVNWNAQDGDLITFEYQGTTGSSRGWIEISRDAKDNYVAGVTTMVGGANLGVPSTLTIATDTITITSSNHMVDTEAAAATDDLATINGGTDGTLLILGTFSSVRDVTVKNGIGNIFCGSDRVLNTAGDKILLLKRGTQWHMICYADN